MVRDVLLLNADRRGRDVARNMITPALVTHKGRAAENLLMEMQPQGRELAVVIDDLGSLAGIVTMENILEEIIVDFEDETDTDNDSIRRMPSGGWLLNGSLRPDELESHVGIRLPARGAVVGYVIDALD